MNRAGAAVVLGLALAGVLAGCGRGEAPRQAQFVPPAPALAELDGLRAHYNLLPTLSLGEAVAREYGVRRADDSALLVVALRRPDAAGDEASAEGEVSAEVVDLAGRRQQVVLRRVRTGDYIDHVGTVQVHAHETIRVHVAVVADGRRQEFDFQRNF